MVTRDTSLAMSIGDFSKPLPANFLDPIHLCDAVNNHYDLRTPKDLLRRRVIDAATQTPVAGQPRFWSIFDEAVQFESSFNAAVGMQLLCYKAAAPLSLLVSCNKASTDQCLRSGPISGRGASSTNDAKRKRGAPKRRLEKRGG